MVDALHASVAAVETCSSMVVEENVLGAVVNCSNMADALHALVAAVGTCSSMVVEENAWVVVVTCSSTVAEENALVVAAKHKCRAHRQLH